jgi:hypothetical protein
MHLYHLSCYEEAKKESVPQLVLVEGSDTLGIRNYECEKCGTRVHIDMDWTDTQEKAKGLRSVIDKAY